MAGIENLVQAFTGGGRLERKAYEDRMSRLTQAESARALLESRLAQAYADNQERAALDELPKYFTGEDLALIMSGKANQAESLSRRAGVTTQNTARDEALEYARTKEGNDLFNFLIGVAGDKQITPSHLNTENQADANFAKTIAETIAASELARSRGALANTRVAEGAESPLKPTGLDSAQLALLYQPERKVPNPNYVEDNFLWFDKGDPTITEPAKDMAGDFYKFQAEMAGDNPKSPYWNADYALAKFFEKLGLDQNTAGQVVAGAQGQAAPAKPNRRLIYDPAQGKVVDKQ